MENIYIRLNSFDQFDINLLFPLSPDRLHILKIASKVSPKDVLCQKISEIVHFVSDNTSPTDYDHIRSVNNSASTFNDLAIVRDDKLNDIFQMNIDIEDLNEQTQAYIKSMDDEPRDIIISLIWRYLRLIHLVDLYIQQG